MVTSAIVRYNKDRRTIELCALARYYLATAVAEPNVTTFFSSSTLYYNLITIEQEVASLAIFENNGGLASLILLKQASLGAHLGARDCP